MAKIDRSAEASQERHFLYVHLKGRVTNQQRKLLTKTPGGGCHTFRVALIQFCIKQME
jgi:hypothetical protein